MSFYDGAADTLLWDYYFEVGRSNFFSKRSIKNLPLKRTKSVTKLERSKRGGGILSSNHSIQSSLLSTTTTAATSPPVHHNHTANPSFHLGYQPPSHHLSSTHLGPSGHALVSRGMLEGGGGATAPGDGALGTMAPLRASQSHESLLASHNEKMMNTLDLTAGESVIKPLHESILGQKYCFQISSPAGTRYYSCRSAEERDKWVESLRRAVNPHQDHRSRVHNSVRVTIVEAKGIAPKKRYFCELLLDEALYARTSSKPKQELCFWGEQFEFKSLPSVQTIAVVLYREGEKRRKKEKQTLVGRVHIPVSSVCGRSLVEKWYSVETAPSSGAKGGSKGVGGGGGVSRDNTPSLRIKCTFQTVHILPLETYCEFHQFLLDSYSGICSLLEPVVSVATKADVATTLVQLTQHSRAATALIADIVVAEIDKNDDAHLIFRGNSVGTKAMEAFMKLVGERYLHETLRPAVTAILLGELDCEVDPKKVSNESVIPKNRQHLISVVQMTWTRIIQSPVGFPPELRQCFVLFRERLQGMAKEDLSDKLISASIFLRFLCPAILNPSLFNITQELPNEKATRNLTLVAKTLQTLANFTKFQGKEQFMEFMNDFIENEQEQMKTFLRKISTRTNSDQRDLEFSGEIDLGVQLSVLQTLLAECLPNMKPETQEEHFYRDTLKRLIDELEYAKSHPNNDLVQGLVSQTTSSSTSATMINYQRLDERRQRLKLLTDNVFRYNDPTSVHAFSNYADVHQNNGGRAGVDGAGNKLAGSQQRSHVTGNTEYSPDGHLPQSGASVHPLCNPPSTPRSSTLPRSTYLMGSGRKPAMDLQTADDYVHYSALNVNSDDRPVRGPHPIEHSYSQSHIPSDSPAGSSTPLQLYNPSHHRHFHNHMVRYNNNGSPYNTAEPLNPHHFGGQQHGNANSGHHPDGVANDSLNSSHDYDQNSSGDAETNMKGSQTSISQLSNIASSGYQSFAYSQSSSPVDPVITDVTNNNNGNHSNSNINTSSSINNSNNNNNNIHSNQTVMAGNANSKGLLSDPVSKAQMPQITQVQQPPLQVAALAFNNPMYHLNSNSGSPRLNANNRVPPAQVLPHHFLINSSQGSQQLQQTGLRAYPLSHSQSSHATSYGSSSSPRDLYQHHHRLQGDRNHGLSSLNSAQSVEDLLCARVTLSGSEDTSSIVSTASTPPQSSAETSSRLGSNCYTDTVHQNLPSASFKSSAPRTNPRCLPPPSWQPQHHIQQQQQQQDHAHSSITNIPASTNTADTTSNKPYQDHHHSTSDLLSSSYPDQRRTSQKNSRRQSAEFGSSRQRLHVLNNYDSTSDDTSSDERQGYGHHVRQRHHITTVVSGVPNKGSAHRGSETKSLEEYENEILTLKRMLDNLQIELKEKHNCNTSSSPPSSPSPPSSCASSNTPPSPAPISPPVPSNHSSKHVQNNSRMKPATASMGVAQHQHYLNDQRPLLSVAPTPASAASKNLPRDEPKRRKPSLEHSLCSSGVTAAAAAAPAAVPSASDTGDQTTQLQDLLKKLLAVQSEKDAVIAAQKQHITSLDDTNNRLMQAYQHLTKHMNRMDLASLDPETSAAVAAASAAAAATTGPATASNKYTDGGDYNGSSC